MGGWVISQHRCAQVMLLCVYGVHLHSDAHTHTRCYIRNMSNISDINNIDCIRNTLMMIYVYALYVQSAALGSCPLGEAGEECRSRALKCV